jgi:RNA 3'-terminal phosphate cyclase (ATP)
MGVGAKANIRKWGWFPVGGGIVEVVIEGGSITTVSPDTVENGGNESQSPGRAGKRLPLVGLDLRHPGELLRVRGVSVSSNLPKHIRVRQERAALQALRSNGVNARIDVVDAPAQGLGTAVFLWAESENAVAGFTSLGKRGKPAERVAEEAARGLLAYLASGAALDQYLADQLVLPMALAEGGSAFTTQSVTQHLLTSAWVVNQFLPGRVHVEGEEGEPGTCRVG